MNERESEETTEFSRVTDMPGYYISSNAPHSGEFVPVAMHDKLKRQRDMLLEALKANEAFVTEMVTLGGKYPFLNGTNIIPDAYAQLKRMSVAIAAVEMEK